MWPRHDYKEEKWLRVSNLNHQFLFVFNTNINTLFYRVHRAGLSTCLLCYGGLIFLRSALSLIGTHNIQIEDLLVA